MMEGPDISVIAALIGNPASANMLLALMAGPALTSTELAQEAGLSLATTSGHLARLEKARLVTIERQGRHRYYRLTDDIVARALEGLLPLAERAGHLRTRPGPRDPQLRYARSCYDHLAGDLAVQMYDHFLANGHITRDADDLTLTPGGRSFFLRSGIDLAPWTPATAAYAAPASTGASDAATSPEPSVVRSFRTSWRNAGQRANRAAASSASPRKASARSRHGSVGNGRSPPDRQSSSAIPRSYQRRDRSTIRTTDSMTGTSTSTPTTVASAAPD